MFRRNDADLDGCRHVLVEVRPDHPRGGVALAVEDGQWLITLMGMAGERPPADLAGFTEYAGSLSTADLHDIVAAATPIGNASRRAFPAFSWYRYDRMGRLPEGYAVSGDAVCSFDPRFAQGMSVAVIEAVELGRVPDEHGLSRIGLRLLSAAQWAVQDAWELATGSDLTIPEIAGPRPLSWRLTNAYMQRLLAVSHRDPTVAAALVRVIGHARTPA